MFDLNKIVQTTCFVGHLLLHHFFKCQFFNIVLQIYTVLSLIMILILESSSVIKVFSFATLAWSPKNTEKINRVLYTVNVKQKRNRNDTNIIKPTGVCLSLCMQTTVPKTNIRFRRDKSNTSRQWKPSIKTESPNVLKSEMSQKWKNLKSSL